MSVTNLAKRRGEMLDDIMTFHRDNLPKICLLYTSRCV